MTAKQELKQARKELARVQREYEEACAVAALAKLTPIVALGKDRALQSDYSALLRVMSRLAKRQPNTEKARATSAANRRAQTDARIAAAKPKVRSKKELAIELDMTRQNLAAIERRRK